jgi:hypothetical protein
VNHRLFLLLLAAGAVACGKGSAEPGLGLVDASAVAVFNGVAVEKNPGVHPYVAIANASRDELVLVDALDDKPVLAPVWIRSLEIPIPEARPAFLVAGKLGDGTGDGIDPADATGAGLRADLLVVAPAAMAASGTALASVVHVVDTWSGKPGVVPALDVRLDGAIQAMTAGPVPTLDAGGTWRATPGQVRLYVALSGERLAVITYARDPSDPTYPDKAIRVASGPVYQDLAVGADRFQATGLALLKGVDVDTSSPAAFKDSDPVDPRFLFAATPDPVPVAGSGGTTFVLGVAELDVTGTPGSFTWRGLSARAPTTVVGAMRLRERIPNDVETDVAKTSDFFQTTPVDRVYAAIDPGACGFEFPVGCGIAVIDRATGLPAADPAGLMPYVAPMNLPGDAIAIVPSRPPGVGPDDAGGLNAAFAPPLWMRIAPGSGQRATSAVAAVPSTDGRVYFADLGRYTVPNNVSMIEGTTTSAGVTSVLSVQVGSSPAALGVWRVDEAAGTVDLVFTTATAKSAIVLTPGFTTTETFTVEYQPILPGLAGQRADLGTASDGRAWLALQQHVPAGSSHLERVVRLYSPALGIHRGDIVVLDTSKVSATLAACPPDDPTTTAKNEALIEAQVADFLVPDPARYPGGALVLGHDPTGNAKWAACLDALAASPPADGAVTVELRAAGLAMIGTSAGYLGRPTISSTAPSLIRDANRPEYDGFRLIYRVPGASGLEALDEDALACPLMPWPADPSAVDCRDDTCRSTCERLLLARKARRFYYVSDKCNTLSAQSTCAEDWPGPTQDPAKPTDFRPYDFPIANGPVIAFKLGITGATPSRPDLGMTRGLALVISTRAGLAPAHRGPTSLNYSQTVQTGVVPFDRTRFDPKYRNDGYRYYASSASGFALDFSPSTSANLTTTLR